MAEAISDQKRKELESALSDFEALLITDQVKSKEKIFLKQAHTEEVKLQTSEGMKTYLFLVSRLVQISKVLFYNLNFLI